MSIKLYQFNDSSLSNSDSGRISSSYSKSKHLKKFNLILDIDETLIQTLQLPFNKTRKKIHSHNDGNIVIIDFPKKDGSLIYLRPSLFEFLEYCYQNFYVSYWTTGTNNYCKAVLDGILTEKQMKQTRIIFTRFKDNKVMDLVTKKKYKIEKVNDRICKPLDFLFNHETFKKKFNKNNTILVDDNPLHISINQRNSIYIYPWCRYDKNDDKLKKLIDIFKKNKNIKNIGELKYDTKTLFQTNYPDVNAYECRHSMEDDYLAKHYKAPTKIVSSKKTKNNN